MKKLLLILTISLATAQAAAACSCLLRATPSGKSAAEIKRLREQDVKTHLKKADAVFFGKVVSTTYKPAATENEPSYFEIKFKLERTWKGTGGDEITVFTPDSRCVGYRFSVGEIYLVYAVQEETDRQLWAYNCGGALTSDIAADDLRILGKGRKVKSE